MVKIYLCSKSQIKHDVIKNLFTILLNVINNNSDFINTLNIIPILLEKTEERNKIKQLINEGIAYECLSKIIDVQRHIKSNKIELQENDKIVSLENGIYIVNSNIYYDVWVMMVYDNYTKKITRYNSFGVQIDANLFEIYLNPVYNSCIKSFVYDHEDELNNTNVNNNLDNDLITDEIKNNITNYFDIIFIKNNTIIGYTISFASFISHYFNVCEKNWIQDPRFGNTNRYSQLKNCCDKYLINTIVFNNSIQNNINITAILAEPILLNILYDLLISIIQNNYDLSQIDYFVGFNQNTQNLGIVSLLAHIFKKGIIMIGREMNIESNILFLEHSEKYRSDNEFDEIIFDRKKQKRRKIEKPKKNVLLLDDLLTNGKSIVCAATILNKVNLSIVGVMTVFDMPELRHITKKLLDTHNICYKIVINLNNIPNDFMPLKYEIPDIMLKRINTICEEKKSNNDIGRNYTLSVKEWLKFDEYNYCNPDEIRKIDAEKMKKIKVIYTNKDKNLATKILDILLNQTVIDHNQLKETSFTDNLYANITNEQFSNGETRIKINTSIRDMHVVIVCQTRTNHINDDIVEMLMILDACNRAGADKITLVLPYYPYSRSDKKDDPRCPIGASAIAKLIRNMHVNNLISVDVHAGQIQGYIDKGFHNLYMKNYICDFMYKYYLRFYNKCEWNKYFILIAPDAGFAKVIKGYSSILGINNIILDKERDYSNPGTVIKSRYIGSKQDFENKTGLIIDDMADTMGTLCSAAEELVLNGMKDIIVFVTHGVLSGAAIDRINKTSYIKEVVVSDSLPQEHNIAKSPKIKVVSCAELIARSIDGILTGRSISRLFNS